ncbi:ABC transporter ATP-binding protein [Paenibacillus ginsengarvi]|uniref:ABC transporter ATP-binding protein n=1 Tax=Paenibacillus ginsengarvi TaxID=400777 RepID=A0A3B0BUP9_9BACL|nr:ABC transporter ATP-binding protein [Paenibacillus ginsengarvi]RKN77153.1 ABC transporter ATP-binding protein [Paenibacillus ginsengarvi]
MNELSFGRTNSWKEIVVSIRWAAGVITRVAPWQAVLLTGLAILEGVAPVLSIYATQHLIDSVIAVAGQGRDGFPKLLPWLLLFAVSLALGHEVVWKFRDPLLTRVRLKAQLDLEKKRLVHASELPLTFYEESASYDRMTRSADPGRKISELLHYLLFMGKGAISVVGVAALFWNVSPWLAAVLVAVVVPRAIHGAKSSRQWMSFTYDQTEEIRRSSYVSGLLTGRAQQKEVRVFDLPGLLSRRWETLRREQRKGALEVKRRMEIGGIPSAALYWATEIAVVVMLALWLAPHRITPGIFMSLFQALGKMSAGAGSINFGISVLHRNSIGIGYVRELLQIPADSASRGSKFFPDRLVQGIRLNGVSFTYPGRERPVLQKLDLHLRPGERVALVGENGAGKSTIVRLLLGLYRPDEGTITADGVDYADIAPESLHKHVSAVFQDYYKFTFTAAQSVALCETATAAHHAIAEAGPERAASSGHRSEDEAEPIRSGIASIERVRSAAARGGAHPFIAELPLGYDTPIGRLFEGSRELSEGQWQRIAISRPFLRDPQLLVLDEPTAALDAKAEADIYEQFVSAAEDRAVLLISHRLGSARLADRIVVLQDGKIVEDGNHEQLLAAGGVYAQMWEVQAGWYR